jgi:hypothetical protein
MGPIFGSIYQVPFDLDIAGVLDEDHRNPALRRGLHGLQRPCAWQVLTADLHEIEPRAKETAEDMRLGVRQELALPQYIRFRVFRDSEQEAPCFLVNRI